MTNSDGATYQKTDSQPKKVVPYQLDTMNCRMILFGTKARTSSSGLKSQPFYGYSSRI